ncbi:MAG TPA: type II secretion system protein [Thermoanaerobaculia bacterium]|nr:type II secretion system protein [Thermoanaerobaculia bacterium]
MASSERRRSGQEGYTLAALLVILTILAVVIAYSVPPQWSVIMKRERERHTIWVMKQYARSIQEFQRKRGVYPVSLEQLAEQTNPRILRRMYSNPLTGEVDWILVAAGTPTPAQTAGTAPPGLPQPPQNPQVPPPVRQPSLGGAGGRQVGPFIGVRLANQGESFLELNGANRYEDWVYTINELQRDQGLTAGAPGGIPYQTVPKVPRPQPTP